MEKEKSSKRTSNKKDKKRSIGSTEPNLPIINEIIEHENSFHDAIPTENKGVIVSIDTPNQKIEIKQVAPEEMLTNIKDLDVARKMLKIYQSANDRNLEYDLSFKTVQRLMSYKKCYYTGVEFKEDGLLGRSFDRVDSSKGYIEGNVVACTVDINQKKSNLSVEEIIILYEKLVLKIS